MTNSVIEAIKRAAVNLKKTAVEVPEWGVTVYVREITAESREKYAELLSDTSAVQNSKMASLLAACLVDENNELVIKNNEDLTVLNKSSASIVQRLFDAALDINGMSSKAQDEIKKN